MMTDDYVLKQASFYAYAVTQEEKDNILYRIGTHLEVLPSQGNSDLTPEQRLIVLDKASKYLEKLGGSDGT